MQLQLKAFALDEIFNLVFKPPSMLIISVFNFLEQFTHQFRSIWNRRVQITNPTYVIAVRAIALCAFGSLGGYKCCSCARVFEY